ncbi:hypothetical protein BaRGS_00026207 [Batillaria attramentaria]|uniref:XK-related protein n=1 Tax=Batillaria attramentaria TaxID=370345 RepID=A0ABD0K6L2_9CAEN
MSNTGSDPTRPQTADADSEDAGTGDTLSTSTELTTTRSPTGDVTADTLLPPTEPQTTKHDADAVEVEENLLASAEQHDPDIIRDDTQNSRPTWRTRKPWKLAQQVIVTNHTRFTGLEFVLSILRIVLYIVDLVTDLHLASSYFQDGLVNYGALTTTFFGLAYIVVVFFGLARYVDNSDVPAAWWVCRIVFLILGLSPVIL